ncbi:MAG: CapA family protein [Lachnospiraceae bacterium]|jgi:hypothetical protein|nr:CapA family protein [Lachnospiraceae bacterium]
MKIALLGDIALFGENTAEYYKKFTTRLAWVKSALEECDYVIGNLETPLTDCNKVIGGKSAYIKGSTKDAELLKWLGVTHVSLANNHVFDYGIKGMNDTIKTLEARNIKWYGVNKKNEKIADKDSSISLRGYCCYSTNGKGLGENPPCVDIFNPYQMEKEIEIDEANGCLTLLSCHWGQEHVHFPNFDHVCTMRKMLKNHEVIVHGHHPHVIQGIEQIGKSIVSYSLGNFCFDDVYTNKSKEPLIKLSPANRESFIWIITINNNHILDYYCIPFSFYSCIYQRDDNICRKIDEWSEKIHINPREYNKLRNKMLLEYINSRKKKRNLTWYVKRFNTESIKIIIGARKNKNCYNQLIEKYIHS